MDPGADSGSVDPFTMQQTKESRPEAWLLSAYRAESHAAWADWLLASQTQLRWRRVELPGRYFRWRIRGNPLSWLDQLPDADGSTGIPIRPVCPNQDRLEDLMDVGLLVLRLGRLPFRRLRRPGQRFVDNVDLFRARVQCPVVLSAAVDIEFFVHLLVFEHQQRGER